MKMNGQMEPHGMTQLRLSSFVCQESTAVAACVGGQNHDNRTVRLLPSAVASAQCKVSNRFVHTHADPILDITEWHAKFAKATELITAVHPHGRSRESPEK